MRCDCRFCQKFDDLEHDLTRTTQASLRAQRRGDFDDAKVLDRDRLRIMTQQRRCLELCDRRGR